jgi:phosphomannomutase
MADVYDQIFKAYDIRGKVGTELNAEVAERVGRAFADWLPTEGSVAVGRDMRPDSAELASAVIKGLRAQGRDVIDIGEVTSDMIYFAVGHFELAGGAVVTASHNPGEYNGIKLCREGAGGVGIESGLADIRDAVRASEWKPSTGEGQLEQRDIAEDWVQHVLTFVDVNKLKPLKIAVDAGNGMAGKIFPELEPYVPFEVTEMYFDLDGTFPNHPASPIEVENLADLIKMITDNGLDAGVAFDGDGDRAFLVDEQGNQVTGTVMTALLANYFLIKEPGAIILHNAICGRVVPETIDRSGGKAIRTKVGHSYIKNDMKTHSALFAGEHSGHYYFKDNYNADSGLIAAVMGLAILSASGKKLSELTAPYREAYVQIQETNFEVSDKDAVLARLTDTFQDAKQDTLDGLTVSFESSWFNVRPSNTEPLLRLNAEAKSQEELDALVAKVTKLITE